jgi:hypothetical protein
MKVKDLIEKLKRMDSEETVASALWVSSDVSEYAQMLGHKLTQEEINTALNEVEDSCDAEVGINWASLEVAIDCIVDGRSTPQKSMKDLTGENSIHIIYTNESDEIMITMLSDGSGSVYERRSHIRPDEINEIEYTIDADGAIHADDTIYDGDMNIIREYWEDTYKK